MVFSAKGLSLNRAKSAKYVWFVCLHFHFPDENKNTKSLREGGRAMRLSLGCTEEIMALLCGAAGQSYNLLSREK